jgi:hypothetical protein
MTIMAQDRSTDDAHTPTTKRALSFNEVVAHWSGVLVVVLGALVGLAGIVAWIFSGRVAAEKDSALRRFQDESKAAVSAADARAAEANLKAATAMEGTAAANERTARLEVEAASAKERTARLEAEASAANERTARVEVGMEAQRERAATAERQLLELQARISDRRLSPEQAQAITSALAGVKVTGTLSVICVGGGPEPCSFAAQVVEALTSAGLPVDFGEPNRGVMFVGASPTGVGLVTRSQSGPAWGIMLQRALQAGGIEAPAEFREDAAEDSVVIRVGHKQ